MDSREKGDRMLWRMRRLRKAVKPRRQLLVMLGRERVDNE
jgi:hypothetical protein